MRVCSKCGKEIDVVNDGYVKILDNFLQVNYFETDELNCFCSNEFLLEHLMAETIYDEDD